MADTEVVQHDIESFLPTEPEMAALKAEEATPEKPAAAPKLVIDRAVLLKALGHIQSVVERRNTIPILSNVKLAAIKGALALTATDMEMAVTETVDAEVEAEGVLTVPAHTFYDIIRKLPDGSQVELDGSKEGVLVIRAGACKFSLSSLPADEFPVMDELGLSHHFTLPVAECVALIDKTRFAISMEETRYYLNGIFLHAAKNQQDAVLRAVATDGHRLARMEVELPEGAAGMPGVIVPRKAVLELRKIAEESETLVSISLSATKIRFICGKVVLLSKLIDGTFPDYEKVIPAGNSNSMEVDGGAFVTSVDRVATIVSEKSRAVKFALEGGKLVLSASGEGNGTAREELEVQYGGEGIEIGFNSRYLLEMMAAVESETVQFLFADGSAPALVRDTSDPRQLYVIMPMRV